MTEAEKALEATWIHERTNAIIPLEHLQTIRKAMQGIDELEKLRAEVEYNRKFFSLGEKEERVSSLVKAMTKIQTVSAHMQSKRSYELNKIATDALKNFNSDETGVGL